MRRFIIAYQYWKPGLLFRLRGEQWYRDRQVDPIFIDWDLAWKLAGIILRSRAIGRTEPCSMLVKTQKERLSPQRKSWSMGKSTK